MKIPFCDLTRISESIKTDITSAVCRVLCSGIYVNGPEADKFAEEWASYCGHSHCITTGSGSAALQVAASMFLTRAEVQANTLLDTALGLCQGLDQQEGRFAVRDIDFSGNVAGTISADTVPVLLYGRYPSGLGDAVVVDACQAHGWKPPDDVAAAWSFYPTKNLGGIGDGGAVTYSGQPHDPSVLAKTDQLGASVRMSEVTAAVLRVKLKHLDEWNSERQQIAAWYWDYRPEIIKPILCTSLSNYHIFAVLCEDSNHRSHVLTQLYCHNIGAKIHYSVPLHVAMTGEKPGRFPMAERWCNRVLSLPCYPGLTTEDVRYVCDCINV